MAFSDKDQRPYDLTILYMEDAREWCEYIFDLFTPYDVFQNSEDITDFPTQQNTLDAITLSLVKIIIISPGFLEKCCSDLEGLLSDSPKQVVGLLCGVGEEELQTIAPKLPSFTDWTLADAQEEMKAVTQATMKILDAAWKKFDPQHMGGVGDGDGDGGEIVDQTYADMRGTAGQLDIYAPMDSGATETEDLYVFTDQKQEDIYSIQDTYDFLTVVPSRIKCKSKKKFYIISPNKLFEEGTTCVVKISRSSAEEHLEGCPVNPYVLTVSPPKALPSGDVNIIITCEGSTVGHATATVVSVMDELAENLRDCLEPLNFMCESLGVSPADANQLDNLLYSHVQSIEQTCSMKNALTSSQAGTQSSGKSDKRYPTALHFAANFGLKNITNYLLTLPGADNACTLRNRDNLTPADIAKKSGHSELSDIMQYLPEPDKKPTGYVYMKKGVKLGYDKPKDVEKLHEQLDQGQSIYDMIYTDQSFIRHEDEEPEEDTNQNYDVVKSGAKVVAGPQLPSRLVPTTSPPPTAVKPPASPNMSESQQQLWELDRMIKNKEISMEEAHKRFTMWTSANMIPAPPPKPVTNPKGKQPWFKKPNQAPIPDPVRDQRAQSTISRPILASSHSVPQTSSVPFLRAGSVGSDVGPPDPMKSPLKQGSSVVIPLPANTTRPPSTARPLPGMRRSIIDMEYAPPSREPPPIPPHLPPDDDDQAPARPPPPPPQKPSPAVATRPKPRPNGRKGPVPVPRH